MIDTRNRTRRAPDHLPMGIVPTAESIGVREHQIDQERISRRAYEIYEARHRADGHADEDWFQAAAEYAAYSRMEPIPFDHYRGNSSFSNRSRRAL